MLLSAHLTHPLPVASPVQSQLNPSLGTVQLPRRVHAHVELGLRPLADAKRADGITMWRSSPSSLTPRGSSTLTATSHPPPGWVEVMKSPQGSSSAPKSLAGVQPLNHQMAAWPEAHVSVQAGSWDQ
ncbi:hypothetical protein EYF80_055021 [Liparis tanakae]|uniref:Uncharacterized protein n=1 Tax=Liparis tanakae TaxID=230148 RepID=A0A4Z2F1B6_9TELE|nr:hypothetical protein EYF80_055021 [Liparis tanakae]